MHFNLEENSMIWRVSALFLAYWLLAAHFLRDGSIVMSTVIGLAPLLLFCKHKVALRLLQGGLLLAIFAVWLPSTFNIAEYRIATDRAWLRMAAIMSAVMIFNLLAAWGISGLISSVKK